jgi:hypothetical protein
MMCLPKNEESLPKHTVLYRHSENGRTASSVAVLDEDGRTG